MKRTVLVATALLLLLSLCGANASAASVGTWLTYREDISCASGYGDIDATFWYNGSLNISGATAINLSLPCAISALDQTATEFTIYNTGTAPANNATYNLTVNGVAVITDSWCNVSVENTSTLASMVSAGVTNTDNYLNFSFDCNQSTTIIGINITGSNVAFSTGFLSLITIKEKDVTRLPYVATSSTTSIHAVNNSFNISSTALWFSVTNTVFNLTFPSHKISTSTSTFEAPTLANNGSYQNYTQYQKYGPYVYDVDEDIDGRTHEVTINLKSNEVLTLCVLWELDPDDDVYDGAFDTLDFDSLEVELNSGDMDWAEDEDTGEVEIEDFTLREGFSNNKFVFTWTVPAPISVTPARTIVDDISDFLANDLGYGIPMWLVMGIVIFVIIVLAAWQFGIPKKKSRKKHKKS